jgi:hypothetical protein
MEFPTTRTAQSGSATKMSPALVTRVLSASEARALPRGTTVGDRHGGCSFIDNVAVVLESRSTRGWMDIGIGTDRWTVIVIDS